MFAPLILLLFAALGDAQEGCMEPPIANAVFDTERPYYGVRYPPSTTVRFHCSELYVLYDTDSELIVPDGYAEVECKFNDVYRNMHYACRPIGENIYCKLPTGLGLVATPSQELYEINTDVTFSCGDGFVGDEFTSFCESTGNFYPSPPTCSPICKLPVHEGLIVSPESETYGPGLKIRLSCKVGYEFNSGYQYRRCQTTGQFYPRIVSTTCKRIKCEPPIKDPNGQYTPVKYEYELADSVEYSCNEGYWLDGKTKRTCDRSNVFLFPSPVCRKIVCGKPMDIDNGNYEQQKNEYDLDELVTYTCALNYKLSTSSGERYCRMNDDRKTAQFEKEPMCEEILCENPMTIDNGRIVKPDTIYRVDSVVLYACNLGFKMIGKPDITCKLNSDSTSASFTMAPVCMPIVCTAPMPISFGSFTPTATTYFLGDTITHKCSRGYVIDGLSVATCKLNDDLMTADFTKAPTCLEIRCYEPVGISYGNYDPIALSYRFDSVLTYKCDYGYKMIGGEIVTCNLNEGYLTATLTENPTCEEIMCSAPGGIENGYYTVEKKSYSLEEKVQYKCDEGYYIDGKDVATCIHIPGTDFATFTDITAVCKRIPCNLPMGIDNGYYLEKENPEYWIGDSVKYECNKNYKLSNLYKNIAICFLDEDTTTASFTDPPTCEHIVCTEPHMVKNADYSPIKDSYIVSESVKYTCKKGFKLNRPNPLSTCLLQSDSISAKFSSAPRCIPILCSEPGNFENGNYSPERTTYPIGQTITYKCALNYKLEGKSTATCEQNGLTTAIFTESPECIPIKCGMPGYTSNGSYDPKYSEYSIGDTVLYTCNRGYKMALYKPTAECMLNDDKVTASFTTAPECEREFCPMPMSPVNGYIDPYYQYGNKYAVGDIITYGCDECYEMEGDVSGKCEPGEIFDKLVPVCKIRNCIGYPTIPMSGKIVPLRKRFDCGETIQYVCANGFTLKGDKQTSCMSDGTFSGTTPTCEAVTCDVPELPNACKIIQKSEKYQYNSRIRYICDFGYTAVGETEATCQDDGTFSYMPPTCKPNTCSVPVAPVNGFVEMAGLTEFSVGDIVTYSCEKYYILNGRYNNKCGDSGSWITETPTCDPPSCFGFCETDQFIDRPCKCDPECVIRGDCCPDYRDECQTYSCRGRCVDDPADVDPADDDLCSCLPYCANVKVGYNNCCADYLTKCPLEWYRLFE